MPLTTYNDGASHTVTSGTFTGGILIDVDPSTGNPTTLILSNATVTGQDAHETYPPTAFSDVEGGYHGITVMTGCTYTDAGNNIVTGGNGLAGKTTEAYDGTPALNLPTYGAGDGLFAAMGANITFASGSTYTGGNYTAGDVGSVPMLGGAGARLLAPASLTIGASTFQGGTSESTLQGGAGLIIQTNVTGGIALDSAATYAGGSGASTGASIVLGSGGGAVASFGMREVASVSGPIAVNLAAGGSLQFQWSIPNGTLTTSSVSGNLFDGGTLSCPINAGGSPSVVNVTGPPGTSTLQY